MWTVSVFVFSLLIATLPWTADTETWQRRERRGTPNAIGVELKESGEFAVRLNDGSKIVRLEVCGAFRCSEAFDVGYQGGNGKVCTADVLHTEDCHEIKISYDTVTHDKSAAPNPCGLNITSAGIVTLTIKAKTNACSVRVTNGEIYVPTTGSNDSTLVWVWIVVTIIVVLAIGISVTVVIVVCRRKRRNAEAKVKMAKAEEEEKRSKLVVNETVVPPPPPPPATKTKTVPPPLSTPTPSTAPTQATSIEPATPAPMGTPSLPPLPTPVPTLVPSPPTQTAAVAKKEEQLPAPPVAPAPKPKETRPVAKRSLPPPPTQTSSAGSSGQRKRRRPKLEMSTEDFVEPDKVTGAPRPRKEPRRKRKSTATPPPPPPSTDDQTPPPPPPTLPSEGEERGRGRAGAAVEAVKGKAEAVVDECCPEERTARSHSPDPSAPAPAKRAKKEALVKFPLSDSTTRQSGSRTESREQPEGAKKKVSKKKSTDPPQPPPTRK